MKRRIAKKVLRREGRSIVDWLPSNYSNFQLDRALLRWHRDQRVLARRYGRWDARPASIRREHRAKGYVFPQEFPQQVCL